MVSSQGLYNIHLKTGLSQTILWWFYETIFTKKAKKSGGTKNKLYCERRQGDR